MALRPNPFKGRTSEAATSDQSFVRHLAPEVLQELQIDLRRPMTRLIKSPPGGGKTTLLRTVAPGPLLTVCQNLTQFPETADVLEQIGAIIDNRPAVLGIMITCAAGYADLPAVSGTGEVADGRFRALFNARVVLRALSAAAILLGESAASKPWRSIDIVLPEGLQLRHIPVTTQWDALNHWATDVEDAVFNALDSLGPSLEQEIPSHATLEAIHWLANVRFRRRDQTNEVIPVLLVDDVQWLSRSQRELLLRELLNGRHNVSIWLAERFLPSIQAAPISQGAKINRDYEEHELNDIWGAKGRRRFTAFAISVARRRISDRDEVTEGEFEACLASTLGGDAVAYEKLRNAISELRQKLTAYATTPRYSSWLTPVLNAPSEGLEEDALRLQIELIKVERGEANPQRTLDILPMLPNEEDRVSQDLAGIAEQFLSFHYKVPLYFGIERISLLATANIEEFLALCAVLYEGLLPKFIKRQRPRILDASEQHRLITQWASRRFESIATSHTQGARAERLLEGIGRYAVQQTFRPNAPIATGVTGVGIESSEFQRLMDSTGGERGLLRDVLAECIADNLFDTRPILQGYKEWRVLYLNRLLCAHFGLSYRYGGWQPVSPDMLNRWMNADYERNPKRIRTTR